MVNAISRPLPLVGIVAVSKSLCCHQSTWFWSPDSQQRSTLLWHAFLCRLGADARSSYVWTPIPKAESWCAGRRRLTAVPALCGRKNTRIHQYWNSHSSDRGTASTATFKTVVVRVVSLDPKSLFSEMTLSLSLNPCFTRESVSKKSASWNFNCKVPINCQLLMSLASLRPIGEGDPKDNGIHYSRH